MTARFDVTPKTTEQNRIVRKSEAEVTNNKKKLRSRYCTIEADRHEASRGLSATAELLVNISIKPQITNVANVKHVLDQL